MPMCPKVVRCWFRLTLGIDMESNLRTRSKSTLPVPVALSGEFFSWLHYPGAISLGSLEGRYHASGKSRRDATAAEADTLACRAGISLLGVFDWGTREMAAFRGRCSLGNPGLVGWRAPTVLCPVAFWSVLMWPFWSVLMGQQSEYFWRSPITDISVSRSRGSLNDLLCSLQVA